MGAPLTLDRLYREAQLLRGCGGVSEENRGCGFSPAFLDRDTGRIWPSLRADGTPAPVLLLDGLPDELVILRAGGGRVLAASPSVLAGFVREGRFYTREEAAASVTGILFGQD
jgi:hypothetical protein